MFRKTWFLSLVLILAFSLTACDNTPAEVEEEKDQTEVNETVEEETTASVGYEDIKISPLEAYEIYMEKYPDAKITQIQLDKDFGSYVYKVEGLDTDTEYELILNPVNGEITKENSEKEYDNDYDEGEITKAHLEKIDELVNSALKDAGEGAVIEEWTLESDDGRVILEIEIDKKGIDDVEYKYDVETGELVEKDE